MNIKLRFIGKEIEKIKKTNLYRNLRFGEIKGAHITINGKQLLNLCSNDYLGLPPKKIKNKQMQSSSRLVSGNAGDFKELEYLLAKHKSQKKSLVYPTGYMTNLGVIPTVTQKGDLILSDSLNHASIIEACRLSDASVSIYSHNDMDALSAKLKQKAKNKFVITEGIFSMDGDYAKLDKIAEIAQKTNATIILDDAHGDFVVGKDGRGTAYQFGKSKDIDIYISSLSKGLGSFGGYVASDKNVIEYCVNKSRSFIYTSALPSFLVEYAIKRLKMDREKHRKKLENNTRKLVRGLQQIGYEIKSPSHIVPIIIGEEKLALEFGRFIMKNGIYAQPIRYPTVQKNKAGLRISVTAWLSEKDIEYTLSVFEKAAKIFRVLSV